MCGNDVPISLATVRSQAKAPTIRYYEQIGLPRKPARTPDNRRLYGADDIRRLVFIRRARELGFEVEAIRAMLSLQDEAYQSCLAADAIARARLAEVEQQIKSLLKLKVELKRMITDCSRRRVSNCRIIEAIGQDSGAKS